MTSLEKIIKARSKLMKGNIGMASMLLHLDLVEVEKSRCKTMATDGKSIFFFPDFVESCNETELKGVLVHEALHCVYEHPLRRGKRHIKVWNIACDYAINAFLVYDLKFELPEGGLLERKYKGMTAEKIYQVLVKDEDSLEDAIDQMSSGNSTTDKENISSSNWDSIPDSIGQVWDAKNEEGKPLNEGEISELKSEIQRAVSLGQKLEKMIGNGTQSFSNQASPNQDVKVDWKETLNDLLWSTFSSENSWSRLNKRHAWRGINLPSKAKSAQGGELAIAIDTSGSVSQYELNMFATEIQAMAENCGLEKIRVCYCDTTVRKNEQGEWWDIYELDQGDELVLKVRGGGGTRFDPPFNLFNDYSDDVENVQAFIYFTDGWGTVSADVEPDVPVIWCVTEDSSYANDLPFGEVILVATEDFYLK